MKVLRGLEPGLAGEWLRGRIGGWATVGGVAGTGFEAYARVLHPIPARRLSWEDPGGGMVPRVVEERDWSWADVAAAVGGVMHPLVQWARLSDEAGGVRLDDGWEIGQTRDGWLDPRLWAALVPHLSRADAPDVILGFWTGRGDFDRTGRHVVIAVEGDDAVGPVPRDVPRVSSDALEARALGELLEIPGQEGTGREYLMLRGELSLLGDPDWGFGAGIGWWGPFRDPMPQLVWPTDHAWLVASEIDWDSTIVAGSRDLVDAVLADPAFEGFEVGPEGRLDWDGDTVNPARGERR